MENRSVGSPLLEHSGTLFRLDDRGCAGRKFSGSSATWLLITILLALWSNGGCRTPAPAGELPTSSILNREYLVVHSSFPIPRRHRLVDELLLRRQDVAETLELELSDEPVHIFLFDDPLAFANWLREREPELAGRRAIFEQSDTDLRVFAVWGDRVAEDLRHEVTHGYLHGAIPDLPLWLDEGLAEYFETPRSAEGLNSPHVYLLSTAFRRQEWTPGLTRLEKIRDPASMQLRDYAEAWLWVHFLLHHSAQSRQALIEKLRSLQAGGKSDRLVDELLAGIPDADVAVLEHLQGLAREEAKKAAGGQASQQP